LQGHLESALEHHQLHASIADDAGKFIALTNTGLAYDALGDYVRAARCHQQALQVWGL
jgi:hypothetical protein